MAKGRAGTDAWTHHLIGAKLGRPELPAGHIVRPHLLGLLERVETTRFTLISAPAGYGKTTLVSQWLESDPSTPVAWLSLDRLDNDLERFVRYVIAALRRIEEGCLAETEERLSAQNLPPPQDLAETMVHEIEQLGQRVVLVLDDYGYIRAESIHELLSSLIPNLPSTLRFVITSRVDPPLPLSLWRSRHWLHELRAADLRFSREEAGAFFRATHEVELSDEGIATIHERTEGWITGLRLALLSLAGEADPEERVRAFSASDRLIADYLVEEALARQPAEIREFLALTSVLERFSPELCDELLTGTGSASAGRSREILDRLFRKNLFLVPLGPTNDWFRYHHLFRELLVERFDELTAAAPRQEILKHAGDWFCREGWTEDGLKCYVEAGDLDAAEEVVGTHLHEVIISDLSRRTLARWLDLFPADARRTRIPLLVASCYLRSLRFDCDGLERLFDTIDAICSVGGSGRHLRWRKELENDLEFLRGFASFWKGDVEATYRHTSRVVSEASDLREFRVAMASAYFAMSLALTGRWHEHLQFIERRTRGPGVSNSPQQVPFLAANAVVLFYRGDLTRCQSVTTALTTGLGFDVSKFYEATGFLVLGLVAYERNQLDEAERHFLAVESRRFEAMRLMLFGAATGLAQIELLRGNIGAAKRHAVRAHSVALESQSSMLLRSWEAVDVYIADAAGNAVDHNDPPPSEADFTYLLIFAPSYIWAWVRLRSPSAQSRQAALDVIDLALQRAEDHEATGRVIQLSALRALALDALDRRDEAITVLEEALQRGADLGFVRSFVDCGEGIRPLLEAMGERSPDDEYVAMLLDALAASVGTTEARVRSTAVSGDAAPIEDLTNRELDVLELLQQRLTNKEIAAQLGISAGTVKMHTRGIYRKLGVRGRRRAVAAAVELGILAG